MINLSREEGKTAMDFAIPAYSKTLDLLFLQIQPEQLLSRLLDASHPHDPFSPNMYDALKRLYLGAAEASFHGHSGDEHLLFWQWLDEVASLKKNLPPWRILSDYGDRVLVYEQGTPLCRYEQVLSWRETYLRLGQDLIVTAWLAADAQKKLYTVERFAWPATLHTDNRVLSSLMMEAGLAENHYHLYGSAQIYPLSWCCLMNYPDSMEKVGWLENQLFAKSVRGASGNLWDSRRRLWYAVYIRTLLFRRIIGELSDCEVIRKLRKFHKLYGFNTQNHVKEVVMRLRALYGQRFPQPYQQVGSCLDYAFTSELSADIDADQRLAAAERRLLYTCFSLCYSGEMAAGSQWIFYIYLLLKSSFRAELIQLNRQIGFSNFSDYEKRKYALWHDRKDFWNEACRTAFNAPLNSGYVRSIEARLSPAVSVDDMIRSLYDADSAKLFHDDREKITGWRMSRAMDNRAAQESTFYVWHFPKQKDPRLDKPNGDLLFCRNHDQREKTKARACALLDALRCCDYFRQRTRGIDACSNEIGCRPEVFANAYRFLRGRTAHCQNPFSGKPPRLSFTYHAGEDFLEISDGLRAIDEAILFLGLRRGDRIGHALALGTAPHLHYQTKSGLPILSKQDYLDNLVWLCFRSTELNVTMPPHLRSTLEENAARLLHDIYGPLFSDAPPTLREYYHSWLLRGDAPSRYRRDGTLASWFSDEYDFYALNDAGDIPLLESCRKSKKAAMLYYFYHFSDTVKLNGREKVSFEVTEEYLDFLADLQRAMQRHINNIGISIECNPSSNVLIGTFLDYEKHPLFRFCGVTPESDRVSMHVSINTDDQGVFDTSLPFEYALISAVLSQQKGSGTSRLYSDGDIQQYLRRLIRMGWEQVFPAV